MKPGPDSLIVFAKPPIQGEVKTRLHTGIEPAEATDLYAAFLEDSLAQYQRLGPDVRLYVSGDTSDIERRTGNQFHSFQQSGEDLGHRMQHAFAETFAAGYQRIAIIGTDHPSLPDDFIELAFRTLARPQSVVIGPAEDGGYYLLGMNEFYPQLFESMTFSREDVFERTVDRAVGTSAELTILPTWYDVDRPETLTRLLADLSKNGQRAPRTRAVLLRLAARYDWIDPAS